MKATSCQEEQSLSIKCVPPWTTQQRNKGEFCLITIENILHTYTYNEHRESCIQHSCYIKVEWIQTIYTANILFKYFISVAAGHRLAAFRKAEEEKYKNLHQRIRKCQNRRAKCRTLDRAFLVSCWHQLRQRLPKNPFIFTFSPIAGAALCHQTVWSLLRSHQWA